MARLRHAKPVALPLAKAVAFSSIMHRDFIFCNSKLKEKCMAHNICKRLMPGCRELVSNSTFNRQQGLLWPGPVSTAEHKASGAAAL